MIAHALAMGCRAKIGGNVQALCERQADQFHKGAFAVFLAAKTYGVNAQRSTNEGREQGFERNFHAAKLLCGQAIGQGYMESEPFEYKVVAKGAQIVFFKRVQGSPPCNIFLACGGAHGLEGKNAVALKRLHLLLRQASRSDPFGGQGQKMALAVAGGKLLKLKGACGKGRVSCRKLRPTLSR